MFISLHQHSVGSYDSVARIKDIVAKAASFNMPAIALTDHGVLSTIPEFYRQCNKVGIKPILGIEAYISSKHSSVHDSSNRKHNHLVLLAKNLSGWKTLLKIVKRSNEQYYYKPRISLDEIGELNTDQNLIAISGHPGSVLGSVMWEDENAAFNATTYNEAKACVDMQNWREKIDQCIFHHIDVFGKDNFFIEIQRMDEDRLFMAQILNKTLRHAAERLKLRSIATNDAHYVNQDDAILQRLLLCSRMKTTLGKVREKLSNDEDVGMGGFFKSNNYYMLSPEEMQKWHTAEELATTLEIADMCESYKIESPPRCPTFPDVPDGLTHTEYLWNLCIDGFNKLYKGKVDEQFYMDRLKYEFSIYKEAKIENYFLITRDILQSLRNRNKLHGPSRGSVLGSLTASCLEITLKVDPIKYNLLFERFINPDRIKKGEYPDIDVDVPVDERENVINYIKDKYGQNNVCQVATFGEFKGKSALKLVLGATDIPFAIQNEITKCIPDEQKITDDLAEFAEEHDGQKSILRMLLEDNERRRISKEKSNKKLHNDPMELEKFARIEDGKIVGDYAEQFELAIRMEYIQSHQGKHAAAVLISDTSLEEYIPIVKETKGDNLIAGWSYPDCEWAGVLKWDILGLAALDCLQVIAERLHEKGIF